MIFIGVEGDFHMGGTHFGRGEGIDPEGNPAVMLIKSSLSRGKPIFFKLCAFD